MEQSLEPERNQPSPIQIDQVPVQVTTQTDEITFIVKHTFQTIVYTYADGSKKQTHHYHADARVSVDRDDVSDSYESAI
jgi:hypothetical protein